MHKLTQLFSLQQNNSKQIEKNFWLNVAKEGMKEFKQFLFKLF